MSRRGSVWRHCYIRIFFTVVWQWLGDRDCTAQYNCCLPATTDCWRFCRFCLLFFLILYGVTLISTLLLTYLLSRNRTECRLQQLKTIELIQQHVNIHTTWRHYQILLTSCGCCSSSIYDVTCNILVQYYWTVT